MCSAVHCIGQRCKRRQMWPIYLCSSFQGSANIWTMHENQNREHCAVRSLLATLWSKLRSDSRVLHTNNLSIWTLVTSAHAIWSWKNFGALGEGSLVPRRTLSFLFLLALPPCSVPTGASSGSLGALWVPTDVECVQLVVLHCGFLPVSHCRLSGRYYAPPHCFGCLTVIYNHVLI